MQDSRGFIWISTRNGLSRFDGIEFINYFRKDGLSSNLMQKVVEDLSGKIYALSVKGLSGYNGAGFIQYKLPSEFDSYTFSENCCIYKEKSILLIGSKHGDKNSQLILFNGDQYTNYSKQYSALDTLSLINFIYNASTDDLFLLTRDGVISLWKNNELIRISSPGFETLICDHESVYSRFKGRYYVYENKKFQPYQFRMVKGRFNVNLQQNIPHRGLDFYDGRFHYSSKLSFNYDDYMIDSENVMWFRSEGNLDRLVSTAFRNFTENEIGIMNMWAIAEDRNGHMWFGSIYNRLVEYDGKHFTERKGFDNLFGKNLSFYKGSRRMLNGDVWFSTNSGVIIWDGTSFSRLKGIPDATQICYIYEDPDTRMVMIGTEKGLFILQNEKIKQLPGFNDGDLGVIEGITKDENGMYWLSGHNGVLKFDGVNHFPVNQEILPQAYTYTIEKDNFGGLWVTSEEGLYFKNKSSDTFIHGLPESINRSANSICIMDKTHILVGRTSDICVIDLDKFYRNAKDYYRVYDKTDGFEGSDCLDNGIVKDHTGKYWILTSNNVVIFDPEKIKQNLVAPKISITGFRFRTDSSTWEPVAKSGFFYEIPTTLKLSKQQNNILISYIGISTTNPEKVTYSHFLEGYDNKWSLPSSQRSVVFEKLPPGNYSFMLKASNADGIEISGSVYHLFQSFAITFSEKRFSNNCIYPEYCNYNLYYPDYRPTKREATY